MHIKDNKGEKNTTDKNKKDLPEYIQGYKIEREFGNKKIEKCIEEIISLHMLK